MKNKGTGRVEPREARDIKHGGPRLACGCRQTAQVFVDAGDKCDGPITLGIEPQGAVQRLELECGRCQNAPTGVELAEMPAPRQFDTALERTITA